MCSQSFRTLSVIADWPKPGDLLFQPPLAEGAAASSRRGEVIRPRAAGRAHAEAGFVTIPLEQAKLDRTGAGGRNAAIIHLHRVRAFVDLDQRVDDGLAADGDFHLVS